MEIDNGMNGATKICALAGFFLSINIFFHTFSLHLRPMHTDVVLRSKRDIDLKRELLLYVYILHAVYIWLANE